MLGEMTLTSSLPAASALPLSADEVLSRFVAYAGGKGLELYPAQEEAILELFSGKHLVLATPTGSGKSLVATALLFKAMAERKNAFYTCPIKALVNEKFFALCEAFGPENVGLMTGDAAVNKTAPLICCTAEILSNLSLREDRIVADYVVMDEFHYYADKERGVAWQLPLLAMPETTFLLMSATLGDLTALKESLARLTGREVAEVKSAVRPVPLDFEYVETPLHETVQTLLQRGKAPVYLVSFTQRAAVEQAQALLSVDFSTKAEKEALKDALQGARFDTPFGKDLARFLRHGLGLHHAGLLPMYRLLVERLSQSGLLKVISGTDTLGVGVNIPIRTVLFTQLCKFDGEKTGILSVREFLQIAGRAGRKGFDEAGSVVVQAPAHVIENLRLSQKKAQGKKVVMQKPPQKGYAHWDKATFERLLSRPPEPLESRFLVSHGLLLNLLQSAEGTRHGGYRRLVELIARCHERDYVKKKLLASSALYFRTLRAAGLIVVERRTPTQGAHVQVQPGLQRDFSLHHTLSLYLLETLPKLDRAAPTYALDVLSLVESILESPMQVLYAQLDRLKAEKVAELKAKGVEYEERMAELEKLEWPKPLRDFIYDSYNAFAAVHPWVGEENIRPKSVAREMFERCATFNEYVKDHGLQRSEGVLLRYLSEAYKTVVQSVPEALRTDELEDVMAYLRAVVRGTDSSLVEEWERLREEAPVARTEQGAPLPTHGPRFAAAVRAELHRLVKALAVKDYEEAAFCLADGGEWSPQRFEAELAPYWAEYSSIDVTPASRRPQYTQLLEESPQRWTARQTLLDPEGQGEWMVECTVDLARPGKADGPLLSLRRIGT
ncbi:MAG: DEAD/DEAH box helicase [Myxococcota bacterium]